MSDLENELPLDENQLDMFTAMTSKAPAETPAETPAGTPAVEPETVEAPVADSPMIPHARFRQEADRARAAEKARDEAIALLAQYAPKPAAAAPPQPTDMFENPQAFVNEQVSPHISRLERMQYYNARVFAESHLGADAVKEASATFDALHDTGRLDPRDYARVTDHPNPFLEVVEWHKQHKLLTEIGSDPAAYRQRIRDEISKDPEYRASLLAELRQGATRLPGAAPSNVRTLPSTSRIGAATVSESPDEPDDEETFKSVTKRRK
jgi:hypothetical protein